MGSLRKPLEGRSEAHVGFRMRTMLGSHLEKSLSARFPQRVFKKSGREARFLLVTPDRVAIPYSQ